MTTKRQVLIGGEWVDGADGGYDIVNPATEEVVGIAPEASVAASRSTRPAPRRKRSPRGRRPRPTCAPTCCRRPPTRCATHFDDLLPLVIAETGCTATVGKQMQVPQARVRFETYARYALESNVIPLPPMEMPATALAPGGLMGAIARRQPVGAVACITPYNFPIVNMAGKLGPALAMGNTVVVRPASQNPLAVIDLVKLMHDVGFPPGVVNVVTGSTPGDR